MATENPFTEAQFLGILSSMVVVFFLTTIALCLRLYVRIKITMNLWWDDAILTVGHCFNIVAVGVYMNVRRQAPFVEPDSQLSYELFSTPKIITLGFYISATALVKIAAAMWFLKVVGKHTKWLRRTITIPLCLYIVAYMAAWPMILFRCGVPVRPIDAINKTDCNIGPDIMQHVTNVLAVLNSLSDWIFALAPLYLLSHAAPGMKRTTKMSAVAVIALAIAASLLSLARIPFQNRGAKLGPHWLSNPSLMIAYILAITETAVATMSISLATLQPLVKIARRKWRRRHNRSRYGDDYYADAAHAGPAPARVAAQQQHLPLPLDSGDYGMTSFNRTGSSKSINLSLSILRNLGVLGSMLKTVQEDDSTKLSSNGLEESRTEEDEEASIARAKSLAAAGAAVQGQAIVGGQGAAVARREQDLEAGIAPTRMRASF